MRSLAMVGLLLFSACGSSSEPATAAAPPTTAAPPSSAPAPSAPPPSSAAPVARIPTCRLSPEHGVTVTRHRVQPRVAVGRTRVVVVDRATTHDARDSYCTDTGSAHWLSFPLASPASTTAPELEPCDAYDTLLVAPARVGDEPAVLNCDFQDENASCMVTSRPDGRGDVVLDQTMLDDGAPRVPALAAFGGTMFAARLVPGHVEALVVDAAGHRDAEVGSIPRGLDLEHAQLTLVPRSATAAALWITSGSASQGTVIELGADAHAIGAPTEAARPVGAAAMLETERGGRDAPPHVRLVREAGALAPIGGLDEATPSYHGRAAVRGTTTLAVWSSGTGHDTRIRAAVLDPAAGAIVGTPIEVSTPGAETDVAEIDAFDDHTVVVWDELTGSIWESRAAEIVCE